jgi:hypothetical protein
MSVQSGRHNIAEHRQFTSLNSSTNIIPATYTGAVEGVWLQAEAQNVRVRCDGTAPTASVGTLVYAGDPPMFFPFDPAGIRAIEVTASAKINAEFVGPKKSAYAGC